MARLGRDAGDAADFRGDSHTACAVCGKLYCWGQDSNGQVGDDATTGDVTSPKQV